MHTYTHTLVLRDTHTYPHTHVDRCTHIPTHSYIEILTYSHTIGVQKVLRFYPDFSFMTHHSFLYEPHQHRNYDMKSV